ncbi:MAG: hypothetical protein FWC82_03785, partial [Firmicutes bacterium]|nr:hypothetical protein [Bacillota bacterium]
LEARVAKVACGVGQPYRYPLRRGEEDKISTRPITPVPLTAPIAVGDETGSVEILLDNEVIGESKLYAIESAESLTMWDRLKDIAGKWS